MGSIVAGDPTLWLGIIERVMIYAYVLWVAVLAVALLRRDREGGGSSIAPA